MPCSERDQCPDVLESDGEETASEAAAAQVREPKLSRPAYLSFTLSIVAIGLWVNQGTPAPLVAVLAIAFGVWGRVAIRRSQGRLSGRFFASSGLWSGILHLILIVPYVALGNAGFA